MRNFSIPVLLALSCFHAAAQPGTGNVDTNISSVCGVYQIGNGPNIFSGVSGSRAVLSYDKDLNTVVFTHRAECGIPAAVTNTGFYTYDVSTDGGSTWLNDQSPIYGVQMNPGNGSCMGGSVLGPHRGRYP